MVNSSYTPENNIVTPTRLDDLGGEVVYNLGNIAWMLMSTCLVFIMIPGLGFFYAGLLRRKNALTMIFMSMAVMAVVSFEWFFWGFSLAFSQGANAFIGDLKHFGLMNVDMDVSTGGSNLPQLVYCVYQMMFACITLVIACGAFADRGRFGPMLIFCLLYTSDAADE